MSFANLTVKVRLFLTLAVLCTVMLMVGLLGLRALKNSNAQLDDVYENNLMSTQWVSQMLGNSRDNVLALDEVLLKADAAAVAKYKQVSEKNRALIDALWQKYQGTPMAD